MKKTVHVVPHSHWDREWYFTTSRSKIYLLNNLEKVLRLLEKNDGYDHFILDGQASLLDDYLSWKPEDRERIKKLVKQGKLIVGPWYTQTDQLVISGESIVRNMLYGMNISEEFGEYMNVGYVPDSFGQSSAMPQIYREFGIEDTLFWRGVSDDQVKHTEYKWRGEDGSVVNVYQIPSGYYIGGDIPENNELKNFLREDPFRTVWERSTTDQVLFPNGFDQAPPRENLKDLVDRMDTEYDEFDIVVSTYEKYINAIKSQNPQLEEIAGELLNGKMMRIHKSIFSSRSDLKALNTKVQNYLINKLEPILSIAKSLGFEYPTEIIKEIWKLMFENAAHDSIGSCVSDTTNEDVYFRYKKAYDLAVNLAELKQREIASHIITDKDITITAFNTNSEETSGLFETLLYVPQLDFSIEDNEGNQFSYTIIESEDQTAYILGQGNVLDSIKDQYRPEKVYKVNVAIELSGVPANGYKQFHINLTENSHSIFKESDSDYIENDYYIIKLNAKNTVDIFDKKSDTWYINQAILEENGDDGDSFNYSPPRKDLVIRSTSFKPEIKIESSELIHKITLSYQMKVPKNLEDRKLGISDELLPVTLEITLRKDSPFIDYSVEVDNRFVDSHRLCVLFNSGIASQFSHSDHQFGSIRRPVVRTEEMRLGEGNQDNWNEVPISIETCQSYVALEDGKKGLAVVPKGVREYEIVGESFDTIRLTIFRTYGFMGKENLLYRPGRASGETVIETPDAQLHKVMKYEFSNVYYQGTVNTYKLAKKVNTFLRNIELYQYAEYLNTRLRFTQYPVKQFLPVSNGIFNTNGNLVYSILKKAEKRDGLIARFYNGQENSNETFNILFDKPVKNVELVNLKEDTKKELTVENHQIEFSSIEHGKFVSIYFELL
ncbi:mannosylglycerate hydrolase [Streptococcus pneumoniae]|nr:mannosylglycerate hydrolase [Streptococcus pneumoniae]